LMLSLFALVQPASSKVINLGNASVQVAVI
jgi:hypothetical protein